MSAYSSFANYYDELTANVDYDTRCDYIVSLLKKYGVSDGILLDLACGTGSMSVRLSKAGYDVIGVDNSEEMLAQARENSYDSQILYLCQDMKELDLYGTIRACVCCLDSINHLLSEDDVKTVFSKVSLFTESGGLFVFDVNSPYKHRCVLADNTFVYDMDDVYVVWQNRLDRATDTVDITLDFFEYEDGCYYRECEEFSERAYSVGTIKKLLDETGFEVVGAFDELTENDFNDETQRIYFVARKR